MRQIREVCKFCLLRARGGSDLGIRDNQGVHGADNAYRATDDGQARRIHPRLHCGTAPGCVPGLRGITTAPPVLADDASGQSACDSNPIDLIRPMMTLHPGCPAPDAANEAAGDALPGGDPGVAVESDSAGVTAGICDVIDRASAVDE